MGEEDDTKIIDVDSMFESFVKKKLRQLGMKRAATKATHDGTMNELERSIKMRLERNIAQNSVEEKTENPVENPPKPKKIKKDKKHKKKKKKREREKEVWEEKKPPGKERKSDKSCDMKDKSEVKSQRSKEASNVSDDYKQGKLSEAKSTSEPKLKTTVSSNGGKNTQNRQESLKLTSNYAKFDNLDGHVTKDHRELTPERRSSVPNNSIKIETEYFSAAKDSKEESERRHSRDPTPKVEKSLCAGAKKDIATIKMKIELLKAKSEGEKLYEEVHGLLKKTLQNQTNGLKMEENSTSHKKSELKAADDNIKHRSRSRSQSRYWQHSKSHLNHRTRSHSRERRHGRHHRSRSSSKRSQQSSRSRSRDRYHRRRSRKRNRSPLISSEDKVRLLEIAKANALAQHRAGLAANSVSSIGQIVKEGSMSVTQLTDMCKDISASKEEPVIQDEPLSKEDAEKMVQEAEANQVQHPFQVRDSAITFNIKQIKSVAIESSPTEAKPLTVLSKEFPVSCGQQHRRKEVLESVYGKWEVVAKDEATKKAVKELVASDKVFVEPEETNVDLSNVIAERISAVRQLQEDPSSKDAQDKMIAAQKALDSWTKSQQVPGQFTGHTGLTAMPKSVLEGGKQAWFNFNNLKNAKQVTGIGKSLLQKMGWTPGTPLGKSMPGHLEPLSLDFKTDRRGLSSFMEFPSAPLPKKAKSSVPISMDLTNKHPVSALMEICSKRHWSPPDFRLTDPLNMKSFTFRIIINSDEYVGKPASNKKQAKLLAATVALQNMGLLPKT